MREIDSETWLNALGNPYRRKILRLLSFRPMYPQELARHLRITPRAVIKHLEYLEKFNIITKEEIKRPKGGRDVHLFRFPWNAFFSFDMSNPSCFRVKYAKEKHVKKRRKPKWEERRPSQSLKDIKEKFKKEEIDKIHSELKGISRVHKEIQQLDTKRLDLMLKREDQFKAIDKHFEGNKLVNMILMVYRGLMDRFGTANPWTHKDVMDIAYTDYESAYELIRILEEEIDVVTFNSASDPRNPTWQLKELVEADNYIYN
ncbi:MAG: ArsR/SmtB family transcription factor [Candidatus Hodarchaeales archaeon]|jgi:predicted transcriptional regulator